MTTKRYHTLQYVANGMLSESVSVASEARNSRANSSKEDLEGVEKHCKDERIETVIEHSQRNEMVAGTKCN